MTNSTSTPQVIYSDCVVSTYCWVGVDDSGGACLKTAYPPFTFDPNALTCAIVDTTYKDAIVRVTDLTTGKNVTVKVTDRGPYADPTHRKVDLTKGAWQAMNGANSTPGLLQHCKVELMAPGTPTGSSTTGASNSPSGTSANPSASLQAAASLLSSIQSVLLTGQNCPPPPYTQKDRIIYTGCTQAVSNPITSSSLGTGYAAPGVRALSASSAVNTSVVNTTPYSGTLKPGSFIRPVVGGSIRSGFGWRIHPVTGTRKFHDGVDIGVGVGTTVYAAADGTVIQAGYEPGGYGDKVTVQTNMGLLYFNGHLSQILVSVGQTVKQGQVIAKSGGAPGVLASGTSTGPHLHFGMHTGTNPNKLANNCVDPQKYAPI